MPVTKKTLIRNMLTFAENHSDFGSHGSDKFSFNLDVDWENEEPEFVKPQQISNIRPLDLKILRECAEAGETVLNQVDGKDVVLIVGKTGVGKSLFIQGIAGKEIISHVHISSCCGTDISTNVFESVDPLPGFAIGHGKVSKTKSINCYCKTNLGNSDGNIVYIDLPGWKDTEGAEVDIATSIMISQVIKQARTLRIVLLINYASLLEDRGGAIRGVLKLAHTFVSDFERDMKSFVFLFTHSNEVDIPSSLDQARSYLTNEILRIRQDTEDVEVKKILTFMWQSLLKKYGFVDVLNPLTSDFAHISNFIEKCVWPIRKPAPMANCGMTPKSELKLIAQTQYMINLVHRLLQSIQQWCNPGAIRELKEIKYMFGYFSRYVVIAEIEKTSRKCDYLFQKHVYQQRLRVEEQLARVRDDNAHFDEGNIPLLNDAILQLRAFAAMDDGRTSLQYTEKLLQDAFKNSYSRCTSRNLSFERKIKDFNKMKVLNEGFPCCKKQYRNALNWLKTLIDGICNDVSRTKDHDFECFDVEKCSEHAQNFLMLGAVMRENTIISNYGIGTSTIVSIFESAHHQLCKISTMWASKIVFSGNHDCALFPKILRKLSERAAKLEVFLTILHPHKELPSFTNLVQGIIHALDDLEALVQTYFQTFCSKVQDTPENTEKDVAVITSIKSDFEKLQAPRWQCTKQIYQDMLSNLRNMIIIKAINLENATRACAKNGLCNGEVDGNLYKDFKSFVWFHIYNSNHDFVCSRSDSTYNNYRRRMELVLEQITACGAKVELLSEKNVEKLKAYCKCAAEFKQFKNFK